MSVLQIRDPITNEFVPIAALMGEVYDGSVTFPKITNDTVHKINVQPLRTSLNDMTAIAQETCYFVKDSAYHIAFPSVYYDSQLYLAYRRGTEHASYDGEIVIKRGSETSLSDYGVISVSGKDCRDPKLVEFNGTVYCLFSAREAGQYAKAYACPLSDLSNPVEINAYFIGGQPFVDGSTIYIPCYRDNDVYLAYGNSLSNLEVRKIAGGGNECAITKVDDTFIIIYRDADDSKNGHIIRTKTLDKYEICEFPINAHCPCLYQIGGGSFTYNYLLFSCRSWNRTQNVNNYEGQLDLFIMGTDGEFVSPRINLFAGNNKDVGYTSICRKGSSSTVIIAYYLDFIDSIVVMTVPYARVYYHQLYGDIVYRDISRTQIYFSSSGKKYKIRAPLGTNRIIGLRTSIPTDTPSVLTSSHIYVRSFKTGDVAVEDTLIAVGNGSTLAVDAKMICLQNKFNTPSDYNVASNTDGTFIEV